MSTRFDALAQSVAARFSRRAALRATGAGLTAGLAARAGLVTARQATPDACPPTTEAENVEIARAWHEEVINNRNPAVLEDILAAGVMHHAAGGYPAEMDVAGVTAMMQDFLTAFSDLHITSDFFVAADDMVVQRYTATGTNDGPLGDLPATGRTATWTGINIFRIECGRIVEVWSEVDAVSRNQQLTGETEATPAP